MAFKLATAFLQLDAKGAFGPTGAIDAMTAHVRGMAHAQSGASGAQIPSLRQRFNGMPPAFAGLAGLAGKMQQEAARQDTDRQKLAVQEEANEHLGALAGAAAGAGLRVQVVGSQAGQW